LNGRSLDATPAGFARPLRVLLYSPLAGRDLLSGDTTYTETLISNPPPRVEYTTYADALADGRLVRRGRRPGRGPTTPTDLAILAVRVVEKAARRRWMYPEETWFISVESGAFDLIHNHIFSLRQVGHRLPMLSSAGFPLSELYRSRNRWSARRVERADQRELAVARLLQSHRAGYFAETPDLVSVYSAHYRSWLIDRGMPADRVNVLGQGLSERTPSSNPTSPVVGFIGRDFVRKGGFETIDAFARIRRSVPEAKLLVVTNEASLPAQLREENGIEICTDASHEDVLNVHLPRLSLLLAPTRSDCGVPYAVIESMRAGVPVILSDGPWLDDRLVPPGVHRSSEPTEVAAIAESVLSDPRLQQRARRDAREQFERLFSLEGWHRDLRAAYERTLLLAHGFD
jgi:glycosyltransferase involved in cell wall biosynthesis